MSRKVTKLYQAVCDENIPRIKSLIKAGVDVDEPSSPIADHYCQEAPLSRAVDDGNLMVVKLLVEAGANVNKVDEPPLVPQKGFSSRPGCPLNVAASRGHLEIVEYLISQGASAKKKTRGATESPLYSALSGDEPSKRVEVTRLLLKAGAKPIGEEFDRGYLSFACWQDPAEYSVGLVSLLIEHGADPNAPFSRDGARPLHSAVSHKIDKAVVELLAGGADPTLAALTDFDEDWSGLTPLEYATKSKARKCVALLEKALESRKGGASQKKAAAKSKTVKPKSLTTDKAWERLEAILQERFAKVSKSLKPGASAKGIESIMRMTRIRLTKEIQQFFQRHDGQGKGDGLIVLPDTDSRFSLLGTGDVCREWKVWNDLEKAGDFEGEEIMADAGVREVWWHSKWIPFAGNGLGDFLCFDCGPAKGGAIGQVVTLWHETGTRSIAYPSIREMLNDQVEHYENA